MIQFDHFACNIKNGCYDDSFTFELYDYHSSGEVIKKKYKGCWLVVDNGYLKWSVTIPSAKGSEYRTKIRFSEWIESMRKDVECCFGILKGRWKCLKYGIRLHGIDLADQIWLTCCALHNMLLEVDGLATKWREGVPSYWEDKVDDMSTLPFALRCLARASGKTSFDLSGMGRGNDIDANMPVPGNNDEHNVSDTNQGTEEAISVKDMSYNSFRAKLVRHFNIAFHFNEVKWPSRNKK